MVLIQFDFTHDRLKPTKTEQCDRCIINIYNPAAGSPGILGSNLTEAQSRNSHRPPFTRGIEWIWFSVSYLVSNLCEQLHKVWNYDLASLRAKIQWTCFRGSGPLALAVKEWISTNVHLLFGASHARTVTSASPCAEPPPHSPPPSTTLPCLPKLSYLGRIVGCCWCCLLYNARLWSSPTPRARSRRGWWWSPGPETRRASAPATETQPPACSTVPSTSCRGRPRQNFRPWSPLQSRGFTGPSLLSLPLSASKAFNSYKNFSA